MKPSTLIKISVCVSLIIWAGCYTIVRAPADVENLAIDQQYPSRPDLTDDYSNYSFFDPRISFRNQPRNWFYDDYLNDSYTFGLYYRRSPFRNYFYDYFPDYYGDYYRGYSLYSPYAYGNYGIYDYYPYGYYYTNITPSPSGSAGKIKTNAKKTAWQPILRHRELKDENPPPLINDLLNQTMTSSSTSTAVEKVPPAKEKTVDIAPNTASNSPSQNTGTLRERDRTSAGAKDNRAHDTTSQSTASKSTSKQTASQSSTNSSTSTSSSGRTRTKK